MDFCLWILFIVYCILCSFDIVYWYCLLILDEALLCPLLIVGSYRISERRWWSRRKKLRYTQGWSRGWLFSRLCRDDVPVAVITVIVINALYGVLGSSHLSTIPDLPYGYIRYITWMHRWVRQPPVTSVGEETTSVVRPGWVRGGQAQYSWYHPLHTKPRKQLSTQAVTARPNYKWAGRKPVPICKQVR